MFHIVSNLKETTPNHDERSFSYQIEELSIIAELPYFLMTHQTGSVLQSLFG